MIGPVYEFHPGFQGLPQLGGAGGPGFQPIPLGGAGVNEPPEPGAGMLFWAITPNAPIPMAEANTVIWRNTPDRDLMLIEFAFCFRNIPDAFEVLKKRQKRAASLRCRKLLLNLRVKMK